MKKPTKEKLVSIYAFGVKFDDYKNEDSISAEGITTQHIESQVCKCCAETGEIEIQGENPASTTCGVEGCDNEADYLTSDMAPYLESRVYEAQILYEDDEEPMTVWMAAYDTSFEDVSEDEIFFYGLSYSESSRQAFDNKTDLTVSGEGWSIISVGAIVLKAAEAEPLESVVGNDESYDPQP